MKRVSMSPGHLIPSAGSADPLQQVVHAGFDIPSRDVAAFVHALKARSVAVDVGGSVEFLPADRDPTDPFPRALEVEKKNMKCIKYYQQHGGHVDRVPDVEADRHVVAGLAMYAPKHWWRSALLKEERR